MLRRLSLAVAIAAASSTSVWAAETPASTKTDLVSVYQEAVKNNAALAAARAEYMARIEAVPQARSALLPNLSAVGKVQDTRTNADIRDEKYEPLSVTSQSGNSYQANLSQPLFDAAAWFQLKAAEASNEQAALDFSAIEQDLILQSATAYFSVLRAQDGLATSKAEEAAFKRQLDQSKERFDVGLSDKTDVLEAQAGYDTSVANRIISQQQVDDAFQALTTLTNREYPSIDGMRHSLPILPPTPSDAKAWVDTASQQNLRLLSSNFAVDAAGEKLSQSKSGHAPTLQAVASYGQGDNDNFGLSNRDSYSPYDGNATQSSVGLQLNVPIYSGGNISSQVRQSVEQLNQSEQSREQLRREVVQDTRDLYRAVTSDVQQVQARKQSVISNQSSLEATQIGYEVGTRNIVDVLNAQRSLYAAVRNYNDARYGYILNNLSLKQAAGTLSPTDLSALAQFLNKDYNPDKDYLPPDLAKAAEAQLTGNKNY
jgi:outer membrane protein